MVKEIKEYLQLPWSYTIEQENGYYIIYVNELPGVCSDGKTIEEAMKNIKDAIAGAIELYIEHGESIPEPIQNFDKFNSSFFYGVSFLG